MRPQRRHYSLKGCIQSTMYKYALQTCRRISQNIVLILVL